MIVLNLGCGFATSAHPDVVNVDWSPYIRIRTNSLANAVANAILPEGRRSRLKSLSGKLVAHDLRKGIPYADNSVDVVYHSHMLEHIDRDGVPAFLKEVRRVLKEGGVHRIVVPDFEPLCRAYVEHLDRVAGDPLERTSHDEYIARILEQSVRRWPSGLASLSGLRKAAVASLFGDARARGETHQWMYDRWNLQCLLEECGFRDVCVREAATSGIGDWEKYGLDLKSDGSPRKDLSLYMEAVK